MNNTIAFYAGMMAGAFVASLLTRLVFGGEQEVCPLCADEDVIVAYEILAQ